MAQLIKLEDYVSRYQADLQRYPSQYSRLKKERWYYLKTEWEQSRQKETLIEEEINEEPFQLGSEEENIVKRAFNRIFNRKKYETPKEVLKAPSSQISNLSNYTLDDLRGSFLDELFLSQLRWASSSLVDESSLNPIYKRDQWLRFFTQQFPDNYFLMYKPVFHIKNAPIDLDILLISPSEIICITIIEGNENSIFDASSGRFWIEYVDKTRKKRLSPLVSMSRMTGVLEWIFEQEGISYPIRKVIISPTSLIDDRLRGSNVQFVDRRSFNNWHDNMKRHPSPLKSEQMKVTSILFDYCSVKTIQDKEDEIE